MLRERHRQTGFTLIEMVVVVAIVGILASAARPMWLLSARRAQESELRHALRTLREAIDDYKRASDEGRVARATDASGYPPSLDALVEGIPDARIADGTRKIYFLRRMPRDPFADAAQPAMQSWALRGSESSPQDPQPGRDVFDVASRSKKRALDGSAYSEW